MENDSQSLNLTTEEQNSLLWPCRNRGKSVKCEELYIQTCFEALTALTNWPFLHKIKADMRVDHYLPVIFHLYYYLFA